MADQPTIPDDLQDLYEAMSATRELSLDCRGEQFMLRVHSRSVCNLIERIAKAESALEYHKLRDAEFIEQREAQIKVIDRQKVEIAELKESVEAYRLAHEGEFEEIRSLRAQLEAKQQEIDLRVEQAKALNEDKERFKAQLANLQKPVTPMEWSRHCPRNVGGHVLPGNGIDIANALIRSRLKDRQ